MIREVLERIDAAVPAEKGGTTPKRLHLRAQPRAKGRAGRHRDAAKAER